MEFRILGPLEAWEGDSPIALGGAKPRALLAVLLLNANEVVPTDRLIDALWDEPPGRPTKAVQVYASRLRKALGGGTPTSRTRGYTIRLSPAQLDLARFRLLRDEARRDPARAAEKLVEALALWRGPALAEFADEPFARVERLRLEEERMEALEERIEAELAAGRHAALAAELDALAAAYPLRERLLGQLMLALYRCGRQAEALAAYRESRRRLVDELGIEPGRDLQRLERAILRQDAGLELAPGSSPVAAPARASDPSTPAARASPAGPPGALREERKVVSVLFVELACDRTATDPEDLRALAQTLDDIARREIERFGGTVESFIGDVLMAVFGAPTAHEDDAERAVRSALAILRSSVDAEEELDVRLAVETGVALVALDARPDGGPVTTGDVVTRARRLLAVAPRRGILVGEHTYGATRETIDYRDNSRAAGERSPGSIAAWEVLTARQQLGFDLLREPRSPFVGRRRELDLLVSAVDRVVGERSAQLVTLVGVPGIGKSRLVFELEKREGKRSRATWLHGRCLPYGDGVSFWALGEIVKERAGILDSDDGVRTEQKLRTAVSELVAAADEAAWLERELQPLVGAGRRPERGAGAGQAFAAWRRFLERLAESSPLVLVLEDLHWADEGLLDFVDELALRARDARLLVLCTARPELLELRPGWGGGKANTLTVSLSPLSAEETAALVGAALPRPPLGADVLQTLVARAGGNPLYAEQFARALADVGSAGDLPDTVHGIIAARLDGLPPEEKAVVQDAAVLGDVFWSSAVESLGEADPRRAEELLFALERKEFVQRVGRSPVGSDAEYAFRHVLLRDVAYGQIPRHARAERHRRAARWIESFARPDDHAELLAHHYRNAVDSARAAGRLDAALVESARLAARAAGDRAFGVASYATAAHHYRRALELWPDDDGRERAQLLVRTGHAQHAADGTGLDLLEEGLEWLRRSGSPEDAAEVGVEVARRLWLVGERDAAYEHIERALELVEGRGDSRARAHALVERAAYHSSATEHQQAIRLVREALPLTEALGLDGLRVRALDILGCSRVSLGDTAGLGDARRAVELAREAGAFYRLVVAELNLQGLLVFVGEVAAASAALRACRGDVERYGTADQRDWLRAAEAHEAAFHGDWDSAARLLDERLAEAEAGRHHYSDPACRALRASLAVARGDLEAATVDSGRALEGARRSRDPQLVAPTLTVRAIVRLAAGERTEASRAASEVLARGSILIPALLELHPTVTAVELAWLSRDLGVETRLLAALEQAPPTPWHDAARAIGTGDFEHGVELVARLGAPAVDAYGRLRAAEELARTRRFAEAHTHLEPAIGFFRRVGASRYLARAEQLLAAGRA